MATTSVPTSPREATTRIERGRELYADHGEDIRFDQAEKVWLVPSQRDETSVYEVTLGRRGEWCECRDFEYRSPAGGCVHIIAATLARAKSFRCDGCGDRRPNRERVEVNTEDVAFGHSVSEGERYCQPCARAVGIL